MEFLTLADLGVGSPAADAVEAAVAATAEVDQWCSGPDWIEPVHRGFGSGAEPILIAAGTANDPGFALLARYPAANGEPAVIAGLEPLWGFACPLLGATPEPVADAVVAALSSRTDWHRLILPGFAPSVEPGSRALRVATRLARLGPVGAAPGITRIEAELDDGIDGWWARRGARFRRNLRRARAAADEAGLAIVDVSTDPNAYERILAIEARSWKGRELDGLMSPSMELTYRIMTGRLAALGRLTTFVATIDGVDVGYILGGRRGRRYRGLQLSYDADHPEHSIGHLLQLHQIEQLADSGTAGIYDLGMDLDYKRRWADRAVESLTLVVERVR
ncbi:MAG: GNAT family N-acetyltransferase [Actinomycetota bacterium]